MKICNNCNTTLADSASICPNCGSMVGVDVKEPISVGGWIGRSLIPCIPVVGGLVYLIMLCIWTGDKKKEETFRNWAKAQLIVMAVMVVLIIVLGVVFGATIAEMAEYL